jgi:hypothetical protein
VLQYLQRVRYGRYVAARLARAKLVVLADAVKKATDEVKASGRAVDDAEEEVQAVLALRDGHDDELDEAAKTARNALAGRGVDAMDKAPYTAIFPKGVDYYTAAPLDQQEVRYDELVTRLEKHLEAADELRKETVRLVTAAMKGFGAQRKAVDKARTFASLQATKSQSASDAWERAVERAYGSLVTQLGRARAERFFPRLRREARSNGTDTGTGPEARPAEALQG